MQSSGLGLRPQLDSDWAQENEGPDLDRVDEDHGKLRVAPAGPTAAFAGAHEVTPHQASEWTDLTRQYEGPN